MSTPADKIERIIYAETRKQRPSEIKRELRKYATAAARYARSIAPVDEGDFKRSIKVEDKGYVSGLPVWQVRSDDVKAHWLEYGTVKLQPPFATFAHTARKMTERPR